MNTTVSSANEIVTKIGDARTWANTAMNVQDACNLSGVVHSFSQMMTELRKANPNKNTDWYNRHPIVVMFADKVASLAGVQNLSDMDSYHNAYTWCAKTKSGVRPNDFEYDS